MLVYFGFTYCPDICPTDLQAIGLAMDKLGKDADSVQPLFITVDPARDTPEHLAEYVKTVSSAADRAYRQRGRHPQGGGCLQGLLRQGRSQQGCADYTVDHTAFIYLMDRDGNYLGFFPPGTSAERMVEIIRPRLAEPAR